MPRRTTLTYSSEDAPEVRGDQLHVYYCKFSGRHVLTTNCNINRAPKRRMDGSIVLDTSAYTYKLYTTDGGVKLLKRKSGAIEKQYRQNVGKLPVAYRSEPEGKLLYILPGAVTAYSMQEGQQGAEAGRAPVPPCILPLEDSTAQISLEVDDRADRAQIIKVSADHVRVSITHGISHEDAGGELLEYMRTVLGARLSQLSVLRGVSTRHKLLLVKDVTPATVFDRLQAQLQKQKK